MKKLLLLLAFTAFNSFVFAQKTIKMLQSPAENQFSTINTEGVSILPSGRFVTPVGKVTRITRGAFGLAIAPDASKAVILHHNGVVTVMNLTENLSDNKAVRVPSYDGKIKALDNETFLGVAFSKDNKTAYLSGGDNGNVLIFDAVTHRKLDTITLNGVFNGQQFGDSFTSDLAINPLKMTHSDAIGDELLVLDRGNNRLVRIDIATKKITASIPVGRIPFGISLSKGGTKAFVANVGLYDYPLATGVTPMNKD